MNTFTLILPSHWASYLINDDASGLTDEEKATVDGYMEHQKITWPLSCEDAGFRWNHDASSYGVLACDCQEYVFPATK